MIDYLIGRRKLKWQITLFYRVTNKIVSESGTGKNEKT